MCLQGLNILLESGQGFDLSLNHGLSYPYCTSIDVLPSTLLSGLGLHPYFLGNVMMTLRTYPIRVGNPKNKNGEEIGYSGPVWDDSNELCWEDLNQLPELTTVTKRVRRIFTWSYKQYLNSLRFIKPTHVFLNFVNYLTPEALDNFRFPKNKKPDFMGCGPRNDDIVPFSFHTLENLIYKEYQQYQ